MLFDLTVEADAAAILVDVPLRTSSNRNSGQLRAGCVNKYLPSITNQQHHYRWKKFFSAWSRKWLNQDLIVTQPYIVLFVLCTSKSEAVSAWKTTVLWKWKKITGHLKRTLTPPKKSIEFNIWGKGYRNPLSQFSNFLGSFIDQVQTSYSNFRQPWNNLTYLVLK